MKQGKVPNEWKRAEIIPIHKSSNKEEPLNYRPVSLTSIICKVCEKIIKKQWTRYLEKEENNRQTIWISRRKVMCNKSTEFLLKGD